MILGSDDPFGRVLSGHLTIVTNILPAYLAHSSHNVEGRGQMVLHFDEHRIEENVLLDYRDIEAGLVVLAFVNTWIYLLLRP
jgi:hypothetical protein